MHKIAIAFAILVGAIANAQNIEDSEEYKSIMDTVVLNTAEDLKRMNQWSGVGMIIDNAMNETLNTYKEFYADKEFVKKRVIAQKKNYYDNAWTALFVDILVKYWDNFEFKLSKEGNLEMYFAGEHIGTYFEECRYPDILHGFHDEKYVTIYDDSEPEVNNCTFGALMSNVHSLYDKYGIYYRENRYIGTVGIYEPMCYYRYIRYDFGQGFRWLNGDAPQYVPEKMLDDLKDIIEKWHSHNSRVKAYIIPLLLPSEFAVGRGNVTPSLDNVVISIKDRAGAIMLNNIMVGQLADELSQYRIVDDYMYFITDKTLLRKIYEELYDIYGNPTTRILLDNLDIFDFKINEQGELEIYVADELTWKQGNKVYYDKSIDNGPYNMFFDRAFDATGFKTKDCMLYEKKLKRLYTEMAPDIMSEEIVNCSMVEYKSNGDVKFYSGEKSETSPEIYKRTIEIVKEYCESNNFSRVVFPLIADLREEEDF